MACSVEFLQHVNHVIYSYSRENNWMRTGRAPEAAAEGAEELRRKIVCEVAYAQKVGTAV